MLIFEAKSIIESRLELKKDYGEHIPEYFEALEIAVKCMDKQIELIDTLNDWDIETEVERGDTYSAKLCHDIVRQFSIYAQFDEDGMLMEEDDGRAD